MMINMNHDKYNLDAIHKTRVQLRARTNALAVVAAAAARVIEWFIRIYKSFYNILIYKDW